MIEPPDGSQVSVAANSLWYLEGYVDAGKRAWRTTLRSLPLRVGRQPQMDLQLMSDNVSARHAEILGLENELWIRDLDSTNGTFVNNVRIEGRQRLRHGDLIRFADLEFRLAHYLAPDEEDGPGTTALDSQELAMLLADQGPAVDRMLETRDVTSLFQPIVDLREDATLGWELLSRGTLGGYETAPTELMHTAERFGREVEVSEMCRERGVLQAVALPGRPLIFVNCHPAELRDTGRLLRSIEALLELGDGAVDLVLEIHEAAITDRSNLAELDAGLRELAVQIAFDDFGTGQSRLIELANTPPAFIKFDMEFVRRIDRRSDRQLTVLRSLLTVARDLGARSIAEGIETAAELDACREVGFRFGQGFHLARPRTLQDVL